MKPIYFLLFVFSTSLVADEIPEDFRLLKEVREEKIRELDLKYVKALRKLMEKHTKKGDLKAAVAIDEEIKRIEKKSGDQDPNEGAEKFSIEGKWMCEVSSNAPVERAFTKSHLVDHRKKKHPYKIDNGVIHIKWGGSANWWEKLKIDPKKPDLLKGKNNEGKPVSYRRK